MGVAVPTVALDLAKTWVAQRFNQDWDAVALDLASTLRWALVIPVAAVVFAAMVSTASHYGQRFSTIARRLAAIGAIAAGAVGLLVIAVGGPFQAAPFYLFALCLAATGVAWRLASLGLGPGTSTVTRTLTRSLTPLAMLAGALVFATTWYSAWHFHTSLAAEALWRPQQPKGSLLINGVSAQGREAIVDAYRKAGGEGFTVYNLADERTSTLRVTAPTTINCIKQSAVNNILDVPGSCYPAEMRAPLNILALSDSAPTNSVVADRDLVTDGKVGLLDIAVPSGQLTSAGLTASTVDDQLGGFMPGAVLSPSNPIAKRHHLRPTGYEFVVLSDMRALSVDQRAELRSLIRKAAGAAQLAEEEGFVDETGQRQLSGMAALIGAGAAALFVGGLGIAFAGSHTLIRLLLSDLGLSRRRRFTLATRFSQPVLTAVALGAGLGLLAAWMSGAHDGSGFGSAWILPGLGGLLAYLSLIATYSRAPVREGR